jgi:hypothetical protein
MHGRQPAQYKWLVFISGVKQPPLAQQKTPHDMSTPPPCAGGEGLSTHCPCLWSLVSDKHSPWKCSGQDFIFKLFKASSTQ